MTGLLITTYERPDYLKRCLDSIRMSDIPNDIHILIIDDYSKDERVIDFSSEFMDNIDLDNSQKTILRKTQRTGICESLIIGYNRLFETCYHVINLDADTIVSKNFFEVLTRLINKHPNSLITGFNSLTKNVQGKVRHPIVSESSDGYYLKRSCGGVNLVTNKQNYEKYLLPALNQVHRMRRGNWDTLGIGNYHKNGGMVVVSNPSVVQHIGFDSSMGHNEKACYSIDFPDEQKKTIIINQYFGLGDILFCMNIANDYLAKGHKVIWPVEPQFMSIQKHFPGITFIDKKMLNINYEDRTETVTESSIIIPLRFSQNNLGLHVRDCMKSKYMMFGRDWQEWRDFEIVRDKAAEQKLMDLLRIKDGEPYMVVNRNFKTSIKRVPIVLNTNLRVIEMNPIEGFTMIDWSGVLERATEIHTVSTSIIYLLEKLDLNCVPVIYKRHPEERSHENYEYILTKNKYVLK